MRNRPFIVVAVGLAISFTAVSTWHLAAPLRGDLAARIDVHQGSYQILAYGLPTAERPEYAECLRRRYGVEFRAVAGCIVSPGLISYVEAYDRLASSAANRKFGHDIFEECAQEAHRQWEEKSVQRGMMHE
jgi:hypothetical protein